MSMSKSANSGDMDAARGWAAARFGAEHPDPPFSFVYGAEPSSGFLGTWDLDRTEETLDERRTQRTLTYADPHTGLEVRCEVIEYADYPAVDWVVYFRNTGDQDTPIMEDVQALDVSLPVDPPGTCIVHHVEGGHHHVDAFRPLQDVLEPRRPLTLGGISSYPDLPFFNVEWPGGGVITGIGWTGPWTTDVIRDASDSLSVTAGMNESHFLLHPGERIRIPRMLVMFWKDDRTGGHNVWRQLLLEHYSPRPGGQPLQAPTGEGTEHHTEAQNIAIINWFVENNLRTEYHWMDIGWERPPREDEAHEHLSNCVVNEEIIPSGIRAISDEAHRHGINYLLWFGGAGQLYPNLDRVREHRPELLSDEHTGTDNGNPMINRWMIDYFSGLIADWGLDLFRQDARSAPPEDAHPDRVGINWARSVEGFYEFWDALLERSPNLVIDNCCGGGRNIDLETIGRSIALWRSDYQCAQVYDQAGMQGQTYGLSPWVPLSGSCDRDATPYSMRSSYSPGIQFSWTPDPGPPAADTLGVDLARKLINEYYSVRDCFYGDYYPLTPYSVAETTWMAWQFDRPDLGKGIVQAFRRHESPAADCTFELRGLRPEAEYDLTHFDVPETTRMTGRRLMEDGLRIEITDRPGAVVVRYDQAG